MNEIMRFYMFTKHKYLTFFLRYVLYLFLIAVLWVLRVICNSGLESNHGFESFSEVLGISTIFFILAITILFGIIASRFFEDYINYLLVIYILGKPRNDLCKDMTKSILLISIPAFLGVIAIFLLVNRNVLFAEDRNVLLFFLTGMLASLIGANIITIYLCILKMKRPYKA